MQMQGKTKIFHCVVIHNSISFKSIRFIASSQTQAPHHESETSYIKNWKYTITFLSTENEFSFIFNKTNFHIKCFPLSLVFKMTFNATRKWPIHDNEANVKLINKHVFLKVLVSNLATERCSYLSDFTCSVCASITIHTQSFVMPRSPACFIIYFKRFTQISRIFFCITDSDTTRKCQNTDS